MLSADNSGDVAGADNSTSKNAPAPAAATTGKKSTPKWKHGMGFKPLSGPGSGRHNTPTHGGYEQWTNGHNYPEDP